MVDITVRPETGVGVDLYSAVAEAQHITREAAAARRPGEPLLERTFAAFHATVEQHAKANNAFNYNGLFFNTAPVNDERFSDLEIAFEWAEPDTREPRNDGQTLVGSVFFTRETPDGRDVLAYSMLEGPFGPTIEGHVGRYDYNVPVDMLSSRFDTPDSYNPTLGLPSLGNDEIMGAIGFIDQAVGASPNDGAMDMEMAAIGAGPAAEGTAGV